MDFEQRLQKAIQRGQSASDAEARARAERAMGEEELKRLHSQYRLELSDYIEKCLRKLPQYLPGFQFETVVSDRGWGGKVSRDDFARHAGSRDSVFSRLELVVRPFSSAHVLELQAKGTVRNKEIFNRSQYHPLHETDINTFEHTVDVWVLEFAELYAARS
ncbi:MAG: hypothetical protein KF708_07600 [Pirellulales bacterium]|nr:hypothetical protein [Pirellulales bacterium]